jgi:hypothetical protein
VDDRENGKDRGKSGGLRVIPQQNGRNAAEMGRKSGRMVNRRKSFRWGDNAPGGFEAFSPDAVFSQ